MRYFFFGFLLLISLILIITWPLGAHSQDRNPLGVPMQDKSMTGAKPQPQHIKPVAELGFMDRVWIWVQTTQQSLYQDLRKAVLDVQKNGGWTAPFALMLVSFIYGVVHAVGPGHGKFVISSYVLANEKVVKRGVLLSFVSALFQAFSAIILVMIMTLILGAVAAQVTQVERFLESASYAMIALIGLWLLAGQLRKLFPAQQTMRSPHVKHDHAHNHHHNHHHHDHKDGDCGCGHSHAPDAKSLEGDHLSLHKAASIVFAIGIRPCTGAIVVLTFCFVYGMYLTGILSVFAMAIGTAISVSTLAIIAASSKHLTLKFANTRMGLYTFVSASLGILGSSALILMGILFFIGSISAGRPI